MVKQFVIDYTVKTLDPLAEHEVNGLDYRYVYGFKNLRLSVNISPIDGGAGSIVETGAAGEQIRLYYHQDLRGTADYLTSPVSQKVESWTHYNEWGEITHNAVVKCGCREFDLVKNYTGHEYDAVLNLYYAKARMYDAENRRFTSMDPILDASRYEISEYVTNPAQLMQYLYVQDNPLIFVDPTGQVAVAVAGAIGAALEGGAGAEIVAALVEVGLDALAAVDLAAVLDNLGFKGAIRVTDLGENIQISDGFGNYVVVTKCETLTGIASIATPGIADIPIGENKEYLQRVDCEGAEKGESENKDGTQEKERTINPKGLTQEEEEAINEILKETKKGKPTSGRTEQRVKQGDYDDALEDFNKIPLSNKKEITTQYPDSRGMTGTLSNGKNVTVRAGSSDGSPTLQIPEGASRQVEIRYTSGG